MSLNLPQALQKQHDGDLEFKGNWNKELAKFSEDVKRVRAKRAAEVVDGMGEGVGKGKDDSCTADGKAGDQAVKTK